MDVSLETARLLLRQPRLSDAGRLARFLDNFAVAGNLSTVPYPYHLSDARNWIGSRPPVRPVEQAGFVIELPGEGLIGCIGFGAEHAETELGYWLAQPFWSRGFMSEAVRAVLGWYFSASDGPRLVCGAFHFNRASLAIQHKLGFRQIGERLRLCLARGEEVRHIDTELTRTAWEERRAA